MTRACRLAARALGGAVLLALAVGCARGPKVSQLSGAVTFRGKPVPAGWIAFTPDVGSAGTVRVCQIKDGKYDSSREQTPGVFPGPVLVKIAGFDGQAQKFWPQGKQIFNPVDLKHTVPDGASTQDFTVPDEAGRNVRIEPTADE